MSIYSLPPLISVLITLSLLFLISVHATNATLKRFGVLLCLAVTWWQACYIVLFSIKSEFIANIISRLSYSVIIFIPYLYGHFFHYAGVGKKSKFITVIFYLSLLFLPFIWLSKFFIEGVWHYYFGFYTKCGYLHIAYLALISTMSIYIYAKFLIELKISPKKRSQLKSSLIAFTIFIFAGSDYLIKHGLEFYPLGWVFVSFSFAYLLYKMFLGSFADLSVLAKRLKKEVKIEHEKYLYMIKVFTHDIKNKLSSNLLNLSIANTNYPDDQNITEALSTQKQMIAAVVNLINMFSRDEIILKKSLVNIPELLENFKKEWSRKCQNSNITFYTDTGDNAQISIDNEYMNLVWDNLFYNAFLHTPKNGVIKISFIKDNDFAKIIFSNSGQTIPQESREKIFQKYFLPEEQSPTHKGLGLHYSKMMCERHEGTLEYQISSDGLNQFIVKLPLKIPNHDYL